VGSAWRCGSQSSQRGRYQTEHGYRRQEGQRGGDGYDSDDHRAGRQAAKEGDRYQEHAEQGDDESAPAEEHGTARGRSRHCAGVAVNECGNPPVIHSGPLPGR
jgi:hypothetical protein